MTDPTVAPESTSTLGLSAVEVLTTTRAVRKRLDLTRPVPREVIDECVTIALQAPSGRNRQHWDFIFIDDPELKRRVADIWLRGLAAPAPQSGPAESRDDPQGSGWRRVAESLDHLAEHLHEVPVLLIPCLRVTSRSDLDTIRGQAGGWGSVVPAFWSFMLAAREHGIGTAWTTCHLSYEREMADLLGIPFDTVVQAGLSPVAYTIGTAFKPGPRADQELFTHWDRW
ncbi:nitroreductase family protein [Herbiconiux sp. UC225_62]|uniref:nitroreductase family protein n=1 Tax=Herbiconiux sp. UC225_62 TaxID=3350168 RepID=UPI0036D27A59